MKKVHIVPHMHWDREWYFSTEESRILLVNNMEEIMDKLENDPDYPYYVLDGQTSILEDYFAVKPENRERVRHLVQAGKLIIGPWYTQTDEMVVGGESIVRNLLYGHKDSQEFGAPMKIGYLPDSFGQSSQMPQIFNGFDIQYSIFWRGTSERHGTDKTEFYWESDDGSRVLVQLFPLGYAIGKYLPEDEEALTKRIDKYFSVLDRGATTDHIILPNGHDQMPIQKNIDVIINKLQDLYPDREFFLSRYENIFHELEKNEDLSVLSGEFLDGKYMRVHRSIFSTRMDIKAANTRIENKLTNVLEPLASIAHSLGFEYHHGFIELIWKEIMKNHAHDSIGCCCSDKVHREILNRFFIAEEKTDQLIEFYKRKITDSIKNESGDDLLTAFNLLPYEREEVVTTKVVSKLNAFTLEDMDGTAIPYEVVGKEILDPGLIDRQIVHYGNYDPFYEYSIQWKDTVPAMGYKAYRIKGTSHEAAEISLKETDTHEVETDIYRLRVQANGTLHIKDKRDGSEMDQVLLLENGGDDGDEYDYSPLEGEKLIYSDQTAANISLRQNRYGVDLEIDVELNVPKDLDSRKAGKLDSTVSVTWHVTIPQHQPVIQISATIENEAKDHRLRALIPTEIASSISWSDNQFGLIQRDVVDGAMSVWEKEDWDERPDSIYPMLSFVGLTDGDRGVSVLTNSTREYEIIGGSFDTMAVTLFRSVGVLGKEELVRRPGRPSGIKLPTPDSQMIGKLQLDFALVMHKGSLSQAKVGRMAKEYTTPIQTYNKIPFNAMKLNSSGIVTPTVYSLLEETSADVVLSTLKKAEEENRLLIRFYNPTEEEVEGSFRFHYQEGQIDEVKLNEEPIQPLESQNSEAAVTLKPNQVKAMLF
ncbi:mannosylglycerate hydrolase [Rossellomorea aquimaris]|uniref:mannosylglycerate hydrolase n=1 Tax=Rossellomorea aquimaris TaxID=189382 RepID=UPI001CD2636C|nr:mannosylglycerate hydrolase [Rossellomorea aquimaris]MCA1057618.1 mannosylglycerate hydrolase [Rossellomorea aquimaris]